MLSLRRTLAPLLLLCIGLLAPNMAGAATGPEWRDKVVALASKSFKHPAWGDSHCQRDYALARALAETDHVTLDDDVLFAAAYLRAVAGRQAGSQRRGGRSCRERSRRLRFSPGEA